MLYHLHLLLVFHQELFIFIINLHRRAHVSSKNNELFPMLPSVNKNSERESNPMP